jgi:hypothetical protein
MPALHMRRVPTQHFGGVIPTTYPLTLCMFSRELATLSLAAAGPAENRVRTATKCYLGGRLEHRITTSSRPRFLFVLRRRYHDHVDHISCGRSSDVIPEAICLVGRYTQWLLRTRDSPFLFANGRIHCPSRVVQGVRVLWSNISVNLWISHV